MKSDYSSSLRSSIDPELDDLLRPAQAFEHPDDVVHDRDLTVNEKRAILASWASDACAVEALPALRRRQVAGRLWRSTRFSKRSVRWTGSRKPTRLRPHGPAARCGARR